MKKLLFLIAMLITSKAFAEGWIITDVGRGAQENGGGYHGLGWCNAHDLGDMSLLLGEICQDGLDFAKAYTTANDSAVACTSNYNALSMQYNLKSTAFNSCVSDYNKVLASKNALALSYDSLSSDYDKLLASKKALASIYDSLSLDYNKLVASKNALALIYDSLSSDYNKLISSQNSLSLSYDTLGAKYGTSVAQFNIQVALVKKLRKKCGAPCKKIK